MNHAVAPGAPIRVRPAVQQDRSWMAGVLSERWGSTEVISSGRRHAAHLLPALVAEANGERCGLATYRIDGDETELVTLDALDKSKGIGGALLEASIALARSAGCRRLWLITSNDNLDALRFYQRRNLRLVAVHPGAIDEARALKPAIPVVGDFGIPVHDEVELEIRLG
jgi:GNAT superfamily N-acetyltransferase